MKVKSFATNIDIMVVSVGKSYLDKIVDKYTNGFDEDVIADCHRDIDDFVAGIGKKDVLKNFKLPKELKKFISNHHNCARNLAEKLDSDMNIRDDYDNFYDYNNYYAFYDSLFRYMRTAYNWLREDSHNANMQLCFEFSPKQPSSYSGLSDYKTTYDSIMTEFHYDKYLKYTNHTMTSKEGCAYCISVIYLVIVSNLYKILKYIYLKPNSKKGCNCKQINENVANDMVSKVFKSMSMPEEELQAYVEALRTHFKQSEDIKNKEKIGFTKDLKVLNSRLDRLKTAYLDEDFTRDEYLTEKQNIQREQEALEKRISELSTDNKEVEITLEYLLDLVSRANSLYESSRIDKKRKILKLVFSNFFLNGSNLSYDIRKPFDMFVKRANRLKIWA